MSTSTSENMKVLELEQEISKLTMGMMARNREIVSDLIANLRDRLMPEEVAGVILVSLERLMWFDADLVVFCAENFVPFDVKYEIKRMISVSTYKQLISKGLIPGKDFSIDADGKVLQNPCRRAS